MTTETVKKVYTTDEIITKETLKSLKKDSTGIKEYPVLEFDERALGLLYKGVSETLKFTNVKPAGGRAYAFFKRAFDIIASLFAIIILAIPIGAFALAIFIGDRGNPFFSQVRLTKNGKPFKIYKLRSMCVDAESKFSEVQKENKSDGIAFKSDDDPRITPIGKFIRKTSIDELPQLFNVLRGDMSIIGPRPPLPREVVLYTPEQMDRLLVKGGLSCICQTEGRSDMKFDEWVKSDVEYIRTRSFGLDLKLIFKTFIAVVKKKGAK